MTTEVPDPLDRLARAIEIAIEQGGSATSPEVLAQHPDLWDLLEPMLAPPSPAPDGTATEGPRSTGMPAAGPARLGPYVLIRELGRGGQSEVHLARDTRLDRPVALKLLRAPWFASDERLARFRREALLASRLDHPGICTIYEAGVEGELHYIAMRYHDGQTLGAILADERDRGRLPDATGIAARLRLVATLARALHVAHEAGVLHRDLKPANVMVGADGQPVILDFGLARADESHDGLTESGAVFGTPAYMAPEQIARGSGATDRRTDVYALGVILYECVAGRRPFDGATTFELYRSIREDEPADPRALNPAVPRDLATVIQTALSKEPLRRYVSAAAMADDLDAVLAGRPVSVRSLSVAARLWRWARREPAKAALILSLVIFTPVVASLATYLVLTRPDVQESETRRLESQVEALLEEGFFQLGEEGWTAAIAAFDQARMIQPNAVEARAGQALVRLRRGDCAAALAMLSAGDPDPAIQRLRARALRAAGQGAAADEILRVVGPTGSALTLFMEAAAEMAREAPDRSEPYQRAADLLQSAIMMKGGDRAFYLYELAYAAGHAGDRALAERVARTLATRWPASGSAVLRAAFALMKVGSYEQGSALAREGIHLRPASASGHLYLAAAQLAMGALKEAVAEAETALKLEPQHADAYDTLAIARLKLGQNQAADEAIHQSMALRPGRPEAANILGLITWQANGLDAGRQYFETFTREKPWFAEGWCNLGMALGRAKDVDGSIAAYRRALSIRPDFAEALTNLGLTLQRQGDLDGAIALSQRAMASAPWSVAIRNNLALQLKDAGRCAEALAVLEEALRMDPQDPHTQCDLGLTLSALGRFREALAHLRTGHEIGAKRRDWRFPSQHWIEETDGLVELEERLDEVRSGKGATPSASERLMLAASVCRPKRLFAEAAHQYEAAFAADPSLRADHRSFVLLTAASAALSAAQGDAADAPDDPAARAELRRKALSWLVEELGFWERASADAAGAAPKRGLARSWTDRPAIRKMRDAATLAALPPAEQADWKSLWDRWQGAVASSDGPAGAPASRPARGSDP